MNGQMGSTPHGATTNMIAPGSPSRCGVVIFDEVHWWVPQPSAPFMICFIMFCYRTFVWDVEAAEAWDPLDQKQDQAVLWWSPRPPFEDLWSWLPLVYLIHWLDQILIHSKQWVPPHDTTHRSKKEQHTEVKQNIIQKWNETAYRTETKQQP